LINVKIDKLKAFSFRKPLQRFVITWSGTVPDLSAKQNLIWGKNAKNLSDEIDQQILKDLFNAMSAGK
jgi:hypothetical protein